MHYGNQRVSYRRFETPCTVDYLEEGGFGGSHPGYYAGPYSRWACPSVGPQHHDRIGRSGRNSNHRLLGKSLWGAATSTVQETKDRPSRGLRSSNGHTHGCDRGTYLSGSHHKHPKMGRNTLTSLLEDIKMP